MKLLWICGARGLGGAENTTLQVLGLLARRGWKVEALCRAGAVGDAAAAQGFEVRHAPLGGSLNLRAARAVASALRRRDLAVALVTTADEWVWACLARSARVAVDLVLVRFMSLPLPRRVQRLADRRADAVVAVSHAVRRSLTHVRDAKLHVILVPYRFPPRIDLPSAAERLEARRFVGLPASGAAVGFFGGLTPSKGIDDALAAVAIANARSGETHLAVCGHSLTPDDAREVGARAERRGLGARVHCLGRVERPDVVMTAADAVIVPTRSTLSEAIPLTMLEAMASGTPVCGYRVGGVPEAIGADGEAGRSAEPDDPDDLGRVLVELLADPEGARRIAERALDRLRLEFDPQDAADRYDRLFRSLGTLDSAGDRD